MAEVSKDLKTRAELFVRQIPGEVDADELTQFFSEIGPVRHATVVRDSTGESKRFGFVSFAQAEDATLAIEKCKSLKLRGVKLNVEVAKPRVRPEKSGGKSDSPAEVVQKKETIEKRRPRLLVRNLPWSVKDSKVLEKEFSKYGKVVDALIPRKKDGKMCGFGFVTMRKLAHAKKAVDGSKDLKIDNRAVSVSLAIEKDKYTSGQPDDLPAFDDSDSDDDHDDDTGSKPESVDEDENFIDLDEEEGLEVSSDSEDEDELSSDEEDNQQPAPKRRPTNTVFVRNIPYDATSESLTTHFEQFGPVKYALPVMDKQLNQPKGTAFVAFKTIEAYNECINNSPSTGTTSLLIADDTDPRYVFAGRVLSVTRAVERDTADKLAEVGAKKRQELLGKAPTRKDKRNIYLLNEGRVTEKSTLAKGMSAAELEVREKSYNLRRSQLQKNPALHVSVVRLAVRNIPRSMGPKAFKQLARKAVVTFATQVKKGERQPLTKEELERSLFFENLSGNAKSKHGVVRQAKIITEVKDSGGLGRSRGYGFLEFRNHKCALMALRWLNGHGVTKEEIGADSEPSNEKDTSGKSDTTRRLVVEFAIEHAQVVKRRKDTQQRVKMARDKRTSAEAAERKAKKENGNKRAKPSSSEEAQQAKIRSIIGKKRKFKKMGK